ncbi:hypothetical protein PSAC2689_20420 [Paraburkholderia sacchari]
MSRRERDPRIGVRNDASRTTCSSRLADPLVDWHLPFLFEVKLLLMNFVLLLWLLI